MRRQVSFNLHRKAEQHRDKLARWRQEQLRIISHMPTFSDLPRSSLEDLVGTLQLEKFPAGARIMRQGDMGDDMKIILDGVVDITIKIEGGSSPTAKRKQKQSAIVRHYAALGDKWITELKRSEYFGEVALILEGKRTASAWARTNAMLFSVDRATFQKFTASAAGKTKVQETMFGSRAKIIREEVIASVPLFSTMPTKALDDLKKMMRATTFKRGQYICKQGDDAYHFYIVVQGTCGVYINMRDEKHTHVMRQKQVSTLNSSDFFGEAALLSDDSVRTASVVADSEEVHCPSTFCRRTLFRSSASAAHIAHSQRRRCSFFLRGACCDASRQA